jgi:hypothetical protein
VNPSRISTPVEKEIDRWDFKFHSKLAQFRVLILRNRDPQKTERNEDPWIKFRAELSTTDVNKQKLENFAPCRIEGSDIVKVREACQKHVENMLKLEWEKIIVIGFAQDHTPLADPGDSDHRRDPMVTLQFDFAIGYRSGAYFRREDYDPAGHYFKSRPSELLAGFSWDSATNVHVFPYDEELIGALQMLRARYTALNTEVEKLIKPDKLKDLFINLRNLLPPPPPAKEQKQIRSGKA